MHKKNILLSMILVSSLSVPFLFNPPSIEARSGCCSHHGGVVGCGCGDGTPLSSTCAPYYPECSGSKPIEVEEEPVYVPPVIVKPVPTPVVKKSVVIPSPKPTPTPKPSPKASPTPKASPSPSISPSASASATPVASIEPTESPTPLPSPAEQKVDTKAETQSSGFWGWFKHLFGWG